MARSWLAALLIAVGGATLVGQEPAPSKDDKSKDDGRPEIGLKVSPLIAFSPAKISVRAEMRGGATDYEPFYCPTIIWDWDDGTSSENTADCPPYEEGQSQIRRYYSSSHTFQMAGRYNVRFRLKKGDRTVGGAAVLVQVRAGIRDPSDLP